MTTVGSGTVRRVLVMLVLTVTLTAGLLLYGVADWDFGGWLALVSVFGILAVRFFVPGSSVGEDGVDL